LCARRLLQFARKGASPSLPSLRFGDDDEQLQRKGKPGKRLSASEDPLRLLLVQQVHFNCSCTLFLPVNLAKDDFNDKLDESGIFCGP